MNAEPYQNTKMATKETFKIGDVRRLRAGVVPPDLAVLVGNSPEVKIVDVEHLYGYNRFMKVELGDKNKTTMIVSAKEII